MCDLIQRRGKQQYFMHLQLGQLDPKFLSSRSQPGASPSAVTCEPFSGLDAFHYPVAFVLTWVQLICSFQSPSICWASLSTRQFPGKQQHSHEMADAS